MSQDISPIPRPAGGGVLNSLVNQELRFHPFADIFPLLEGAEFDELVADIKAYGLHEPIVVYEDQIIDGRNRYRACEAAGLDPTYTVYQGDDPVAYVVSLNLHRRHLDESQRAMVASKLATLRRGDNQHSPIGETSQARAAQLLNVGKRSVERATEVRDRGALELVQAVERGEVSVSAAANIATVPVNEQREIVARGAKEILECAKAIRAEAATKRRAARISRIIEISKGNEPLNLERTYPIILADPPWQYEHPISLSRDIEEKYPTMGLDEICALPIAQLASENALLFLWVPPPILEQAFRVITAWGFDYCSGFVWVKPSIGMGYYVRQQHEHLLFARRGEFPAPEPVQRPSSIIEAPRREHSRKPDEAYELIERMYPELPKIELFARQARPGWDVWGNEAPVVADPWDGLDIPDSLRRDLPAKEVVA
jgi:N6-adenosine-specific RNA methylase IME4/ParB-like chromosome segregation protein Spo0J